MRRLFWDIEVSPNVVLSWRTGYKIDINYDGIVNERAIICICYKWEGEKKVHALWWDENQSDATMLEEFFNVAEEADELVAHYGDRFDMPWFKTRCLFHGINSFPIYKTIDTKAWACRNFLFNSNKLDYIAKFLGMGGKISTDYQLWKRVTINNDRKALKQMVEYCMKDVTLLEEVWKKMSFAAAPHTHAGVLSGGERWTCPRDGSTNVHVQKTRVTAAGTIKKQMQCRQCGGYYQISEKAQKDYLNYVKEKKK